MQMNGKDFSWGSLNTLCWAVGSISGSMAEEQENRYACLHDGLAAAVHLGQSIEDTYACLLAAVVCGTEARMLPQIPGHCHPGFVELVRDHARQGQQGSHRVQHHVRFFVVLRTWSCCVAASLHMQAYRP
jgi:CRM1 / Exportin repeat 3